MTLHQPHPELSCPWYFMEAARFPHELSMGLHGGCQACTYALSTPVLRPTHVLGKQHFLQDSGPRTPVSSHESTKLHLSRELEVKTVESCLLGISARNEGQNGPSADKSQEFGLHSITFAPHRPQQRENQTNSGGSIEKCGAIGIGNGKPKKVFTAKPKAEHKHSKPSHVAMRGTTQICRETVTHTHTHNVVLTTAPPR